MKPMLISVPAAAALALAIWGSYATPAYATSWEDPTGPYSTTVVADAGPGGKYYIHRPQRLRSNSHPIAVLLVGTGAHPRNYDALLAQLASHGVVVIADSDRYQADGSKASAALNWLLEQNEVSSSEYLHKLIPSKVLAIGHSSGGTGAVLASIGNPRITSLILYAPALGLARPADLSVPTFVISGSLDTTITPDDVRAKYQQMTKANAWYGEKEKQSHTGFATNPSIQYFTRAWVYTQLFDDSATARGCFYGPNWTFKNASTWKETLKNNSAL